MSWLNVPQNNFAFPEQLAKAGWNKDTVDVFELNEAFAAQSLAVIQQLELDQKKVHEPIILINGL